MTEPRASLPAPEAKTPDARSYESRAACPTCGSGVEEAREEGPEFVRCSSCDLRYRTRVMVGDSRQSWESDYYANPRILEHHTTRVSGFREIAKVLHRFAPERGRLLDVGCGIGVFLELAQGEGWEVAGVEASATAAELARQRVRGPIHHGDFLDFGERESFDAVTCFDVLRSVPHPGETLEKALDVLRPGGILMVRETNGLWQSRSRKRARGQVLAHQYAQQWPPRTMTLTLERAGFATPKVLPSPVFLDGSESAARLRLKRVLSLLSRAVYAASKKTLTPNMLVVAWRPPSGASTE